MLAPAAKRDLRRAPAAAAGLRGLVRPWRLVLDATMGPRHNPLHASGTLAAGLLAIAALTGIYLLCFYRVGAPYASVRELEDEVFLGSFMRALHRYSSDAALVAIGLHVLRMLLEGKTYGPRLLAWITGVVLLGLTTFVGVTGLVLVWDDAARAVALAGARVVDLVPFAEPMSAIFEGERPPGSSFFFMNLFFHLALPLGLVFGLWLHTLRLQRAAWLPSWRVLLGVTAALSLGALLWPAPLGVEADNLRLGGAVRLDFIYTPWLSLAWALPPGLLFALGAALSLVGLAVPWWWRPAAEHRPAVSLHDESRCTGCERCMLDCPFEAISMVPRRLGEGSAMVARVHEQLCVACGLCAGSCERLAIGPPHASARLQLERAKELRRAQKEGGLAIVYCQNEHGAAELDALRKVVPTLATFPLDCIGALHPSTVAVLAHHFAGVFVLGCAPEACQMREGAHLARARLALGQSPALPPSRLDPASVEVCTHNRGELRRTARALARFASARGVPVQTQLAAGTLGRLTRRGLGLGLTGVMVAGLAALSAWAAGVPSETPRLRLALTLSTVGEERCRDLTTAELQALPAHMRLPRQCERTQARYRVRYRLGGQPEHERLVEVAAGEERRTMVWRDELATTTGEQALEVSLEPLAGTQAAPLHLSTVVRFAEGRALLVTSDAARGLVVHGAN